MYLENFPFFGHDLRVEGGAQGWGCLPSMPKDLEWPKFVFPFCHNVYSTLFKTFFLFLENIFSCNVLFHLNMIEDDNLIGTLSQIEKHCETSSGIVSDTNIHVD